jgi:hypothetical protein
MAKWPRLYHERVANLFRRGLYWRRFADVCPNRADFPGTREAVKVLGGRKAVNDLGNSGAVNDLAAAKRRTPPGCEPGQEGKNSKGQV